MSAPGSERAAAEAEARRGEGAADRPSVSRLPWRPALKLAGLAVLAAILSLLVWGLLSEGQGRSLVAQIAASERPMAPAFELEAIWPEDGAWPPELAAVLADGKLSLEELRGRPALLNFWASWCIPCREEAPVLNASARAHQGEVVFVGIDVQDLSGDARGFLREFQVPYVSVRDGSNEIYRAYGLTGVPETYFLDADGRIVARFLGALSAPALEEGIAAITAGGRSGELGRGPHITPG